jgi:hypothetical protein
MLGLIKAQLFWVFTPITVNRWHLLHSDDWSEIARPGAIVGMSFVSPDPIEPVVSSSEQSDSALEHAGKTENHGKYKSLSGTSFLH